MLVLRDQFHYETPLMHPTHIPTKLYSIEIKKFITYKISPVHFYINRSILLGIPYRMYCAWDIYSLYTIKTGQTE